MPERPDDPDRCPSAIHIDTGSRQPWVALPAGTPAVPAYHERERYWPADSLVRLRQVRMQPF